jgi:integrase
MAEGITPRHSRTCSKAKGGSRCSCTPTFQAQAKKDPRTGKRPTKTFPSEQEAIAWRAEQELSIDKGTFRPGARSTIRVELDSLFDAMRAGTVRNRKGRAYKPGVIREYSRDAANHIVPAFGSARPQDLRGSDVQRLVDRLVAEGLAPSTVRNILMPLRVLYRRLLRLEEVLASPMDHLELPADTGKRLRIAPPEEAAELLAAVPAGDRAVWAVAMYAGLRIGEIQALGAEAVDLATGRIAVEWNWDRGERRRVDPKSDAGERAVPVPGVLRDHLLEHRMAGAPTTGLLFGRDVDVAFDISALQRRADRAWEAENLRRLRAAAEDLGVDVDDQDAEQLLAAIAAAGTTAPPLLCRLTFHDCRHTYASMMIEAMAQSREGFNPKLLSKVMGHSSIAITLDRYGHLFPGSEATAASALDAYLQRSDTAARKAAVGDG